MPAQISDEAPIDAAELVRLGRVKSVALAEGTCVVEVGDIETPPIKWIEARMGATRIWSPPTIGESVLLFCPEGELGLSLALRGIASEQFADVGNSLEEVLLFSDGARIAYDPEAHRLTASLPAGSSMIVTAESIEITGDIAITGDVTVTGTIDATTDVIGAGKSLKSHRHSATQPGSGQSGAPA